MRTRVSSWVTGLVGAMLLTHPAPARADAINFEFLTADPAALVFLVTPTNLVTFVGSYYHTGYGVPTTGYAPGDARPSTDGLGNPLTPAEQAAYWGDWFLTDDPSGPALSGSYNMGFTNGITSLALDLIDYRGDGGGGIGSTATLLLFNAASVVVGSQSFTVTTLALPDPSAFRFSVVPTEPAFGAVLGYSLDVGTAIDNIEFTTVPEPVSLVLVGSGLAGLVARRRQRRR